MDESNILEEVKEVFTKFYNEEFSQETLQAKLENLKVDQHFTYEELHAINKSIYNNVRLK